MNNGIGRVWAVNAEGGDEGRPNGVGPVIIENIDKLGGGLPDPSGASEGDVLTVDAQGEPAWEPPTGGEQVQANWTQADSEDPSYIQNKPAVFGMLAGDNIAITEGPSSITIAATNAVPAYAVGDAGKVLQVNAGGTGTQWTNYVPAEVVSSLPASPTSGVLYIVTGA
jgi:hypothetical protein